MKRFAHISDLHIGRSAETNENAAHLCTALVDQGIDCVIATGDLTHRGNVCELELFEEIFAPLLADGRNPAFAFKWAEAVEPAGVPA